MGAFFANSATVAPIRAFGDGRRRDSLLVFLRPFPPFPADGPQPDDHEGHERDPHHRHDHVPEDRDVVLDALPGTAQAVADGRQRARVDHRADRAEQREPQRRHLDQARDDRREGPDDRDHAAHRDRPGALPVQEALGPVHVAAGDQHVPADLVHQGAAAPAAHRERGERPGQFGQRPGEAEGDLRGDRDAARFQEAEQDERAVTGRGEETLHRPPVVPHGVGPCGPCERLGAGRGGGVLGADQARASQYWEPTTHSERELSPCLSRLRRFTPRCWTGPSSRASRTRPSTSRPARRSTPPCAGSPRPRATASSRSPPAAPSTCPARSRTWSPGRVRWPSSPASWRPRSRSTSRCTPTTAPRTSWTATCARWSRSPRSGWRRDWTRCSSRTCGTGRLYRWRRTSTSPPNCWTPALRPTSSWRWRSAWSAARKTAWSAR